MFPLVCKMKSAYWSSTDILTNVGFHRDALATRTTRPGEQRVSGVETSDGNQSLSSRFRTSRKKTSAACEPDSFPDALSYMRLLGGKSDMVVSYQLSRSRIWNAPLVNQASWRLALPKDLNLRDPNFSPVLLCGLTLSHLFAKHRSQLSTRSPWPACEIPKYSHMHAFALHSIHSSS